jgi:hypothetical protein
MTRVQLEHLIRAAADIADDTDIVVIGSQAILGQCGLLLSVKRPVVEDGNESEFGAITLLSKEGKGVVIKDAKRPYR